MPTDLLAIFSEAPLLREAHVTSLGSDPFALPWGQLTTIGLAGQFAVPYVEILQRAPQLQILPLELGGDVLVSRTALTLHHLHTLKLHGNRDDQEQENSLLNALTLPALRHLDLWVFSEEFEKAVVDLLSRSSCSLASISLESPSLYFLEIIVDAVRTPTGFHITDIAWTPQEFNFFFVQMHSSLRMLPNLRTLSMSSRLVDVPYTAMAEMVASRQGSEEGCARLELFQFSHPQLTLVDHDVFRIFGALTARGCRVEIQGLKGFNLGVNADPVRPRSLPLFTARLNNDFQDVAHSYTLEDPSLIF